MARMALGIVGGVIGGALSGGAATSLGFALGTAIGSAVGGMAGGMIDQALFGPNGNKGVRSSDVAVQVSTYGHPIYRVWASMVIAGDLIWVGKRTSKEKSVSAKGGFGGGSGGTYIVYRQSFMVGLCEAEACDVLKIWADAKLIYDATGKSKVKKRYHSLKIRIYKGGPDMQPDTLVEEERGIGRVPAYRHLCSIMFDNMPLRDFGNRVPNIRALVSTHCAEDPKTQLIQDFSTMIGTIDSLMLDPRENGQLYIPTTAPNDGNFFTPSRVATIDGLAAEVTDDAPVANHWGANGRPDISLNGQLAWVQPHHAYGQIYWTREGNVCFRNEVPNDLTFTFQTVGMGNAGGALTGFPVRAESCVPPECASDQITCCLIPHQVSAGSFHITRGGAFDLLWVWSDGSLSNGDVWVFWVGSLHLQAAIPRTAFGALGGFFSGTFRLRDIESDDQGSVYILWSDNTRTRLYYVPPLTPHPLCTAFEPIPPDIDLLPGADVEISELFPGAHTVMYYAPDHSLIIGRENASPGLLKWSLTDEAVVATHPIQFQNNVASFHNARRLKQDTLWIGWPVQLNDIPAGANGYRLFPQFVEIDLRTLTTVQTRTFTDVGAQYPLRGNNFFFPANALYDPVSDAIFAEDVGRLDIGKFAFGMQSDCMSLKEVVESICLATDRLTLSQIDATALANDRVCGFVNDNQRPARELLEILSGLYFFNARERDGQIEFVKRTGNSLLTIPTIDLAAHQEGETMPVALKEVRQQEIELPRDVQMLFFNPDRDYEQDSVQEIRNARVVDTTERVTVNAPLVLTQGEAKAVCSKLARERWMQRSTYEMTLAPPYQRLDVLDVTTVILDDNTARVIRWNEINEGANGLLEMRGVDHRPSVYTDLPIVGGAPGGGGGGVILNETLMSVLYLLDTPLLHDSDDGPVVYFGVSPNKEEGRWGGAEVLRSIDQGVTWDDWSESSVAATLGNARSALGAPEAWTTWDEVNTVDVTLIRGELFTASKLEVLNLANGAMLGDEMIQFRTATLLNSAQNRYRLSGLLRGRRGTEWAVATHTTNERFTLLETAAIKKVTLPLSDRAVRRDYRAVTAELTVEESTLETLTWQARSLKPYAVAHARAVKDDADNFIVTWVRRSRVGVGWQSGAYPALAETSEAYEVDVIHDATLLRTVLTSSPTITYTPAQQFSDGVSADDEIGFAIYQMSAVVGRGFVAVAVPNAPSGLIVLPPPAPLPLPDAPTSLAATTLDSTRIRVTWVITESPNENGIQIWRSTDNVNFDQVFVTEADATAYEDTGLTASTLYYYKVRAFNERGNSAYSNTDSDTTDATPVVTPTAPSLLSVNTISSSRIDGSFTDNSTNETGFKLEMSTNGGGFVQVALLGVNVHTFSKTGLVASTLYAFRVRAYNSAGDSSYSNTASDTTEAIPIPPPTTQNTFFVATSGGSNTNAGTITAPFKTIAKALSVAKAGYTVYLRSGTYLEGIKSSSQTLTTGTSWSSPVTIAAYNGESVTLAPSGSYAVIQFLGGAYKYFIFKDLILDGVNVTNYTVTLDGLAQSGAGYIRFQGCEIKNSPHSGVLVGGQSNYNEFISCNVHHNGDLGDRGPYDHGLYLQSNNNLVEKCLIHHNTAYGVHVYDSHTPHFASYNIIRKNRAYSNSTVATGSAGILIGTGTSNVGENNICYDQPVGLMVGFYNSTNTKVYHNTLTDNSLDGLHIRATSASVIAANNIIFDNTQNIDNRTTSGTTLTKNLLTDPDFVNAGTRDYHLNTGSDAIAAGTTLAVVKDDHDDVTRPQNGGYTQGAYEKV